MVKLVWETVPCGRSSGAKAAVSKLGSCTWLHVGSCVGRSKFRTTAELCNCLNMVRQMSAASFPFLRVLLHSYFLAQNGYKSTCFLCNFLECVSPGCKLLMSAASSVYMCDLQHSWLRK